MCDILCTEMHERHKMINYNLSLLVKLLSVKKGVSQNRFFTCSQTRKTNITKSKISKLGSVIGVNTFPPTMGTKEACIHQLNCFSYTKH